MSENELRHKRSWQEMCSVNFAPSSAPRQHLSREDKRATSADIAANFQRHSLPLATEFLPEPFNSLPLVV